MKIDSIAGNGSFYASTAEGLDKCQWGFTVDINYNIQLEDIRALIEEIEPFMSKHHLFKVVIERSQVWDNDAQKYKKEYQYQAFTNKNTACAPPKPTVMEALEAAVDYFNTTE